MICFQAYCQLPANDSCGSAEFISTGTGGFTIGTFQSDSTNIDSATIQTGEYFHNSLVTAGNDKKSIWYKFYIPSRRGVNIELKQNSNAIATKDVGFTTYKGDQCPPTSTMATAAKITALNQFGSSFNPCMDPGWYLIQVSAKSRAQGKIYLEITTSYPYQYSAVVNATYDAKDSAYDFGNQIVGYGGTRTTLIDYEMGCYTIEDSSEFFPDLGPNYLAYNQSAWFVFHAANDADETYLKWRPTSNCNRYDTIAYRVFKGDCRGGSLQLLDSGFSDWQSGNTCQGNCADIVSNYQCQFDSGFTYSVQFLAHEDYIRTIRFTLGDKTTQYNSSYTKPVSGIAGDMSIVRGNKTFNHGYNCNSYITDHSCGTVNNQPVRVGNFTYNLSQWTSFELDQQSSLSLRYTFIPGDYNSRAYDKLAFRVFKDTITSNCSDIDTSNLIHTGVGNTWYSFTCMDPGKYVVQLLGSDTLWDYSWWKCDGSFHLGGNYQFSVNQSRLPEANRFALQDSTDGDSIYGLNDLPNYTWVSCGIDTISCNDGVQPEDICEPYMKKVMYRTFTVGDADGDGSADSGMVYFQSMNTGYRGYPYYDYHARHRLYKGSAFSLRANQNISAYPDTLKGLVPTTNCFDAYQSTQSVCLTPGQYTLVSYFDSTIITQTERPRVNFYSAKTKFDTYASAENLDTIRGYGTWNGTLDTLTCNQNPDTIAGVYCGVRNTYHVFFLDSTAVVNMGTDYSSFRWGGRYFSLFSGDIRQGKSGLKVVGGDRNWACIRRSQSTSDCLPLTRGWYTIVVSEKTDISYDTLKRNNGGATQLYTIPHYVWLTTRASTVISRQFYRPSLSGYIDSLVNGNQPLSYSSDYSTVSGMPLKLAKYEFPAEYLNCDLDTPMKHFPNSKLCDAQTTDIVYYNFNLAKPSFMRIWGNVSGGTWDVKLYDFDVRSDSSKLATATPIQDCNYNANHAEFCNLQPGTYSIVYFCKRSANQPAQVRPVMYLDSVMTSRFDHAANVYDFGAIPGNGVAIDGKVGEVHPLDTSLPASHDFITCRTGSQLSDPTNSMCNTHINPVVYSGDTNVVMFPYDSAYQYRSNGAYYYPWNSEIRRNLWYSFVINGRGQVTVKLNGLLSNLQRSSGQTFRFSVFETDEDGSLSITQLRSAGKIDSTYASGLTHIAKDYWSCRYNSSGQITFPITACDEVRPRRYFVLVEQTGYYYSDVPMNNANVWMEVTYDSTYIPNTAFDYYSGANPINGLNDNNLVVNGEFEQNGYWTTGKGDWRLRNNAVGGVSGYHAYGYSYYYYRNDTIDLYQDIDVSSYSSFIAAGTATANFSGYIQVRSETTPDEGRYVVEYLNSSGAPISTYTSAWNKTVGSWSLVSDSRKIPTGTVKIRVHLQGLNNGTNYNTDTYYDQVVLRIQIPNRTANTTLAGNTLYRGDLTYFAGATLDSTDIHHQSNLYTSSCYGGNGGTVWYKIKVDSVGYMYYNYQYSYLSGSTVTTAYSDDPYRMKIYRSLTPGDSLNGLEYKQSISANYTHSAVMGGRARYICVEPGTYYIQLNKCTSHSCSDWVIPQVLMNFHTGDYCSNAVPLLLDTLEQQSDRLLVNCHTIGNDFGEDGSNMGCLYGPSGYKSSWFVVNYTDTAKVDLEFSLSEYTDATSNEIRYRTYYGNCQSLTPAPCNNNALTTFTLDCIRAGTYYVQIVTPDDATGELEMKVEAKENTDTSCFPVDIFQPNAAFYYNTGCPENVVEFINTSSQGDSIRYEWDFDYNGLTDTVLHPVIDYPALNQEATYDVKLLVINTSRGSRDSVTIQVTVPFSPFASIANNDTLLCAGDSITLNASISHGVGIWNTGDTTNSITVKRTGKYYFDMQDKANLLVNGSFEQNPSSVGWTTVNGTWRRSSGYSPRDNDYVGYVQNSAGGLSEAYQDIDVSADSIDIDSGIAKSSLTGFLRGYQSFGDEAQLKIEYFDSSNNLLALHRSGYIANPNWVPFTHSRTTPKYTRRVRVWIQSNKISTNNSTSYAFFDDIVFKMRSACSYRDSVTVIINQLPELNMPNDTFFCRGDSFFLNPELTYPSPYYVQDSLNAATTGRLYGNASHTASDGYAILTSSTTYQHGEIEWSDPTLNITDTFIVSFDYFSGGDGGYGLWFYLFNSTTPNSEDHSGGGYSINFDRRAGNQLQINWSGSRRYTVTPGVSFDDGEWHNVRIEYYNQTFYIYFDNILIGSYTDGTTRTQNGYKFGVGARNVNYANRHYVKNIHVSSDNESFLVLPPGPKIGATYSWSDGYTDTARWVTSNSTFKLSVVDRYGCSSNEDSTTIQSVFQYDSLFTQDESVCILLDTFRLTPPVSTGWYYGNNAVDSTGLVTIDSAAKGTNVIYFAVIDTFGCLALDTGLFTLDSVPNLVFDPAGPFCRNDTITPISINHSSGYFYGGAYIDSIGNFNPALTSQRVNMVYYATLDSNCQGVDSMSIIVDSIPDATLPSFNAVCVNDSVVQLTKPDSIGYFTPTSYLDSAGWFNPGIAGTGNHQIRFEITDGNGCTASDSNSITVDSIPDASITSINPLCANDTSIRLQATINSGGLFTTRSYVDTLGWFNPQIAGSGNHSVHYTFVDGNGCSNTDSTIVVVDTIPDASIASAGPYCLNAGIQLLTGAINSGGRFTSTSYLDTIGNFNPLVSDSGWHQVIYSFTDGNGCSDIDTTQVRVDSIPDASIPTTGPFCLNDTVQLVTANSAGGSFTPSSLITTSGWFNPATPGVGTSKIYYSRTDGNSCSNTDSTTITIDSLPDASITPSGPFCQNSGIQTIQPRYHSGGVFRTTSYMDSTGTFNPDTAGVGSHKAVYGLTDGNGCSASDSIQIRVDSIPDASLQSAGPLCANASTITVLPSKFTDGDFTTTSYLDTNGVFDPWIAGAGSHTIYYTRTDGNNCTNTDSIDIVIDSIPDASITSAGPFCANDTIQQLTAAVNSGGSFTTTTYLSSAGLFNPVLAGPGAFTAYYSFTDGKGCSNRDSITITVDTIPNAAITPPNPQCQNGGIFHLTGLINKGGRFEPTSYLDTSGAIDPMAIYPGYFKVFYSFTDGNGCTGNDSSVVTIDSIPDASISPAGPFCSNLSVQQLIPAVNSGGRFTATSYLDTNGFFDPAIADTGWHKAYYTFIDGRGCTNTDSTQIRVDSLPDASIIPAGPFCQNDTIQIITPAVNVGGIFSPTAYLDTTGRLNPALAAVGTHTIYYTIINGVGCSGIDSTDIVIDSIPDASITPAGPFCANAGQQQMSGLINSYGSFNATSYLSATGILEPSIAGPGNHNIYYNLTDGNGCSAMDSTTVVIDTLPDSRIAAAGPFCANAGQQQLSGLTHQTGTFTATSYLTSNGLLDPLVAGSGDHKIFYSVTDGNSCTTVDSTVVHVDTIPDASITAAGPFCLNAGLQTLTAAVNQGGAFVATSYLDTTGELDPVLAGVGNHQVFYSLTDNTGCSNTDSTVIRIDSLPNATINAAGPFCRDAGVQQLTTVLTGGSFTVTNYITSGGGFNPNLAGDTTRRVYYTITDGNGCTNIDSTNIRVDSLPDASISPLGPVCLNDGVQQLVPSVNTGGVFSGSFTTNTGEFDPGAAGTGFHKSFYSVTDGNSCTGTDSVEVEVWDLPNSTILPAGPFCHNADTLTLQVQSSGGTFRGGPYILSDGRFIPTNGLIGSHKVIYEQTDVNGCTSSDSIQIDLIDYPHNTIEVVPDSGCEPLNIRFTTQAEDSIHWSINGNEWIDVPSDTTTLNSGDYVLNLYVENTDGCSLELDTPITVFSLPTAAFAYSPLEIYVDNAYVTFQNQSSPDVVMWDWEFGDGNFSTNENPFNTYTHGGEYSVVQTVTNDHGCIDTSMLTILIRDNLIVFIPDAFSPNGDGDNDIFNVVGVGFTKVTCTIHNRWGERIFETDNFTGWDGIYLDQEAMPGVYVYMITLTDYRGMRHYRKGTVTLLR